MKELSRDCSEASTPPLLEVRRLAKWYSGVPAVLDVSFVLNAGEVLGYLGPNGSGKSTTMAMLTGLLEPSSGTVLFRGSSVTGDLVEFRRNIGYVPEEPHLYSYLTGREHMELVAHLRDLDDRVSRRRIAALLELWGLEHEADAPLSSYSKGMRQKVLISSALLSDPSLLIFDEPTSGLDAMSALVFRHLLTELAASGKAVLYSSHELDDVERTCSRVLILHHGRVVAHDSVGHLHQRLSERSLEAVFRQLVCDTDPARTARDLVAAIHRIT